MKFLASILAVTFSIPAFAYFNEVECIGRANKKNVLIEVERFSHNPCTISHMTIEENGSIKNFSYDMTMRYQQGPSSVRYESRGFTLELDFSPHPIPEYGYTYAGKLFSREVGGYMNDLRCLYR